jgi:hypothetical protein
MFTKLEPLDRVKHADLKIRPVDEFNFASKLTYTLLGGSELKEASKHFPIVFPLKEETNQPCLPMALLSFEKGKNQFVSADGKWTAEYIPQHIKRYPFIFAAVPGKKNQFVVMLDMEASQLNKTEGIAFFNEKGEPEEIITRVQEFLEKFQLDISRTQALTTLLEEKDVLVSKQFTISSGDKKKAVGGFRVVDVKKLENLDDATLAAWVRNGLMGIIYAHLISISNLRKLAAAQGATERTQH